MPARPKIVLGDRVAVPSNPNPIAKRRHVRGWAYLSMDELKRLELKFSVLLESVRMEMRARMMLNE